ncbi:MAG TPA: rhamnogalacturonan acetylesterase [Longimicrobiales bacterium]
MKSRIPLLALLAPAIVLGLAFADPPLTLYIAGDSTAAQKLAEKRPETGWGEDLQQYFDIDQVRVENHARNGRSTRSFLAEGRWQAIVNRLRPGDCVLIQFGHNDESKEKTDRYTPPADFKANLERMVRDVREKLALPILATPVQRRKFDEAGKLVDTHGEYPALTRAVARELEVPLLDMQARSAALLERFGDERSRKLFLQLQPGESPNYPKGVQDNTHFSPRGAELMAREAAEGLKALDIPLSRYVRLPAAAAASGQ